MTRSTRAMSNRFADRQDAGRQLATRLAHLGAESPVVLGLPRGGVPVAFEVAAALHAPLDIILVRKLGVPFQPELGMGAIGEGGALVLNQRVLAQVDVTDAELRAVEGRERAELVRRARRFRGDRPPVALQDRTAIIVDDGIATGGTMRAAIEVARARGVRRVVVAVPVAAVDSLAAIAHLADETVSIMTPPDLWAVGAWYDDFGQTTDDEVVDLLARGSSALALAPTDPDQLARRPIEEDVLVTLADGTQLPGRLSVPVGAAGVVVFAHGSGSSRFSPRNRAVAVTLNRAGLATVLFDLLTTAEADQRELVFDVPLLAARLAEVTTWTRARSALDGLKVGYFGASTGAAAALWATTLPGGEVDAIVSRGGRPDLAAPRLARVRAPTLLVVGSRDHTVLRLNQDAASRLTAPHALEVVPGATHLFEEPGTLDAVIDLARDWFVTHLVARAPRP